MPATALDAKTGGKEIQCDQASLVRKERRCELREILSAVRRVRDPPSEGVARPAGSEPCAANGNARGDA